MYLYHVLIFSINIYGTNCQKKCCIERLLRNSTLSCNLTFRGNPESECPFFYGVQPLGTTICDHVGKLISLGVCLIRRTCIILIKKKCAYNSVMCYHDSDRCCILLFCACKCTNPMALAAEGIIIFCLPKCVHKRTCSCQANCMSI
jgi:hypothetical protein